MDIDESYTNSDHEFRDNDVYALAKYRWTLRQLKSSGVPTESLIANIGCGAGTFNDYLCENGYRVYAIEPDPSPFSIAQSRVPDCCQVENKGLFDINISDAFDAIVIHDVLEHIEDHARAIRRLSEMLKPDGVLVISVPALQYLYGRHDVQLGHFRRYSRKHLTVELARHFHVSKVRYFGFVSIPIVLIFSKLLKRDYPKTSNARRSIPLRLYGMICHLEQRLWEPIGTALLAVAVKREEK